MTTPSANLGLPPPDPESLAHSQRVRQALVEWVGGHPNGISFADYMQWVLYEPGLGYYSAGNTKLGAAGDFVTAPEVSPLFGGVLARQCDQILDKLGRGTIVEFGAGTGVLAETVLTGLQGIDRLERYVIVEVSADLKERQKARLQSLQASLLAKVEWASDPADLQVDGVLIANEVLDALATERFQIGPDGEVLQQRIVVDDSGALSNVWRVADPSLANAVASLQPELGYDLPVGYTSEWSAALEGVLDAMSAVIKRGAILLADYGYGRSTYYAPDRVDGTLTCHFRHHVHGDPLVYPGIQDITAWVDFSRVAERLDEAGMRYVGFTTQAEFLLNGGLPDLLRVAAPETHATLSQGIKTLTLPGEMGERFKFIGFQRDCDVELSGFAGRDFGRLL
ncbi:MAG: SAM-dependent methyltransferase [Pseudomonadota bacterium]